MKKKFWTVLLALLLTMSVSVSATAASHSVSNSNEMEDAFRDASGDEEITITMLTDITVAQALQASEGKTYIINGEGHVLKNVQIVGAGTVEVNADIQSEAQTDSSSTALTVGEYHWDDDDTDTVKVTVNGDISSEGNYSSSVVALSAADVTVNGDVTSRAGTGVQAQDEATVTVNGDVTGGSGVRAYEDATVKVDGNVSSNAYTNTYPDGEGGTRTETYVGIAVNAWGDAAVEVTGNVTAGDIEAETGYGGTGVYAGGDSTVKIGGDVTGGNSKVEIGSGGNGVDAWENATVEIGGSVTGGSFTSDGTAESERSYVYGNGGDGIYMDSTAKVTVGGNVTGGNTDYADGEAGDAVTVYLTFGQTSNNTQGEGEEEHIYQPGSLTVGTHDANGELTGGTASNAEDGNGDGIYYCANNFSYFEAEDLIQSSAKNGHYYFVDSMIHNLRWGMRSSDNFNGTLTEEAADELVEAYEAKMCKLIQDATGVEIPAAISGEGRNGEAAMNAIQALEQSKMETLVTKMTELANMTVETLVKQYGSYAFPSVTIYGITAADGADAVSGFGDADDAIVALLTAQQNNYVRTVTCVNGELTVDKATAHPGETVTITPKAAKGYRVNRVYVGSEVLEPVNGKYTFVMPTEGNITVTAAFVDETAFEAASKATSGAASPTVPQTGDSSNLALWGTVMGAAALLSAGLWFGMRKHS